MSSHKDNEEPLKALVFADECGADVGPRICATDRLLNIPTLSWQLATLARYGVKEAVVLSSKPVDSIYEDPLGRMKVTKLSSPAWTSEGDAIRDVESRDGMRPVDDFVLVRPGSIFNVDVTQLVAEHKRRKDADRNWLVTTSFRKGAGSASSGLVVAFDKATGTLLKYIEEIDELGVAIDVHADNSGLQNGGTVEICSNVVDVGLDVCAPDFLLEFRENFYFDKVRAYIKEKLDGGDAEVFGNRMYAHFLDSTAGQYGTRIHSLASFAQATADILNGWMSPISPSTVKGTGLEDKLLEFRSEYLLERSIVGSNGSVAVGGTIFESVIGDNVEIGSDVTISRSILMDGISIGDRCEIHQSIINTGCKIEDNVFVPRNCFLDSGVRIGPDFRDMNPYSLITLQEQKYLLGDDDSERDEGEFETRNGIQDIQTKGEKWDSDHVGFGGNGRLIDMKLSMKMDPMFVPKIYQLKRFESDDEDEMEEEEDEEMEDTTNRDCGEVNGDVDEIAEDLGSANLDGVTTDTVDESIVAKFNQEVLATIEQAYTDAVDVDNTAIEVKSLKLVYNCSFAETMTGVVAGLALTAMHFYEAAELYAGVCSALHKYESLVTTYNKTDDAHQVQVATGLASALGEHGTLVKYVFKAMYDHDNALLTDDAILAWAASERMRVKSGNGNVLLLDTLSDLLEWLEDSDEEE